MATLSLDRINAIADEYWNSDKCPFISVTRPFHVVDLIHKPSKISNELDSIRSFYRAECLSYGTLDYSKATIGAHSHTRNCESSLDSDLTFSVKEIAQNPSDQISSTINTDSSICLNQIGTDLSTSNAISSAPSTPINQLIDNGTHDNSPSLRLDSQALNIEITTISPLPRSSSEKSSPDVGAISSMVEKPVISSALDTHSPSPTTPETNLLQTEVPSLPFETSPLKLSQLFEAFPGNEFSSSMGLSNADFPTPLVASEVKWSEFDDIADSWEWSMMKEIDRQ